MFVYNGSKLSCTFSISTSKNPPSCIENSFGTPWGLHYICEKIGEDAPKGMVFKGRVPIGSCYDELDEEENKKSLITSRILRLKGYEENINLGDPQDTYNRYVYIHGTNHENEIGQPASAGCVHLSNQDIIDLYPKIPLNALVYISRD